MLDDLYHRSRLHSIFLHTHLNFDILPRFSKFSKKIPPKICLFKLLVTSAWEDGPSLDSTRQGKT